MLGIVAVPLPVPPVFPVHESGNLKTLVLISFGLAHARARGRPKRAMEQIPLPGGNQRVNPAADSLQVAQKLIFGSTSDRPGIATGALI